MPSLRTLGETRARTRLALSREVARSGLRLWRQLDPESLNGWIPSSFRLLQILTTAQLLQAQESEEFIRAALAAQGSRVEPVGALSPQSLAGVASDGRDLLSLLQLPVILAKTRIQRGASVADAMQSGEALLVSSLRTQVSDAGRVADQVNTLTYDGTDWVRVLYGETCSRCAVLAGRVYKAKADFLRHPRCDCYSVPVEHEQSAKDAGLFVDAREYFNSLSPEEQDRIFTKSGAESIRLGADINQVVNARRGANGLSPAGARLTAEQKQQISSGRLVTLNVFGQDVFVTSEGTTRRGLYGQRAAQRGAQLRKDRAETVTRQSRNGAVRRTVQRRRVQTPRLMPESIMDLAKDREDAIRLLRLYGYII